MRSLLTYTAPALAILWFLLPAIQYLGTLQRTALFTQRDVVPGSLIDLDLTPWYVALLGLTIAHFLLRTFLREATPPSGGRVESSSRGTRDPLLPSGTTPPSTGGGVQPTPPSGGRGVGL